MCIKQYLLILDLAEAVSDDGNYHRVKLTLTLMCEKALWCGVHVMRLLFVKYSRACCCFFVLLSSDVLLSTLCLETREFVFFPQGEKNFAPTQITATLKLSIF